LRKLANQIDESHNEDWLAVHSPKSVDTSPESFLEGLYREGESVVIFNDQASQGRLWRRGKSLRRFLHGAPLGVWFLVQPVDGRYYPNPRTGGESRRSEESVTDWRYAVLECDHKPAEVYKPLWLSMLIQMPLDIVALVDSGGKSIAAILRVNALSKAQWDDFGAELKRIFVPLGADRGALTAVRLTRLPGCERIETGRMQRLLWFNPYAAGERTILEYAAR
jgi:hypothetical protein